MKSFTENLKNLILQSEKLQTNICKEMNISKQKLTNWKSGYTEPNLNDLTMLANYFDVTVDFLIGRTDDFGVNTAAPMSDGLSSEERKLIAIYKSLSPDMRETLWSLLATWTPDAQFKSVKN